MELERFREVNGDAGDGYNEYYVPNGNGYGMKTMSRKRSCKKYMSYILNVILFLMLLIFVLMYALYPNCECNNMSNEIPTPSNGHSTYYTMSDAESISNGKHLTSTIQSDQVPNTTHDVGMVDSNTIFTTESIEAAEKDYDSYLEDKLTSEVKESSSEEVFYVLPGDIQPMSYRIMLIPHFLTNMTTNGNVSIKFHCVHETNIVILNARDLIIDETSVVVISLADRGPMEIQYIHYDKESEMLKITLKESLKPYRIYTVAMSFQGMIQDTPKGLYRTMYTENDRTGIMVNTLFSPNDARSVFPCFDEPMYKAKFTFILGRPAAYHTLSNMNIINTIPVFYDAMYYLDTFDQTPPMSTYLTAFAITEFQSVHPSTKETNITFAGHSEPVELSQMTFVLNWMEKLTIFFGKYFNISYPLPKMDLIAVPNQFFGAMENWGLIIFRKNMAFVNEKTTEDDKQRTVITLAHEIAHQWFGNLVTPKWWNNLWLKEGFSTYFGYYAINEKQRDWKINDKFQVEILDQVFKVDALKTSIPLSKTVSKISSAIFDVISYDKGASMIRMMSHFMGSENLRRSVISYLNRHAYSNADEDDLWNVMKENLDEGYTGNIDLKTVMNSWTHHVGYPVVHVARQDNNLIFRQERLLLNGNTDSNSTWWIPISYTTQTERNFNDARPKLWLTEPTVHAENFVNRNDWIIVNLNQTGYYRVNYDDDNWVKLMEGFRTFPNNIKAQLISDSLFLAQASILKYDLALSITLEMTQELNYLPWRAVSNHIFYIGNLVRNMPAYGNFRRLILTLLRRVYTEFDNTANWLENVNDPIQQLHMVNILNMACYFDQPECLKSSYDLYQEMMSTNTEMVPYFTRQIVYCAAVKYGGQRTWDYTYSRLKNTSIPEERSRLLHALGCSKELWLLTKSLSIILPNNEIHLTTEETMTLFQSVTANPLGSHIGVNFIRDQWPYLLTRFGSPSMVYKMVSNIVNFINTPHYVFELKTLVDNIQKETKEKSIVLQQAVELAENNIVWMNKNYIIVASFVDLVVEKYTIH